MIARLTDDNFIIEQNIFNEEKMEDTTFVVNDILGFELIEKRE